MVVGLLGNESPDLNRFILVTPKSENDVRLQATIDNQNPAGLPVGVVSTHLIFPPYIFTGQNRHTRLFSILTYQSFFLRMLLHPLLKFHYSLVIF